MAADTDLIPALEGEKGMSKTEILEELKKLAPAERLSVIESALQQLRGDLVGTGYVRKDEKKQLALAAEALLADHAADGELKAFSVLDGEDFHTKGRGLAD